MTACIVVRYQCVRLGWSVDRGLLIARVEV
jgi:hypothetical protein